MKLCPCNSPNLIREHSLVRCQFCGSIPREDLGGSDDLARLHYRAKLNALRDAAAPRNPNERPSC